ncbi:hypothetical protein ACJ73_05040 [Blastomyces percursus]|uniref:Uncharacterized protein n=1 Tax=Blastomyces percursus TaxID=1658174 RepID=A0A1J9R6I3_9EURO|nr:hypothetical protein ACJ73_05040 [Blastomyces percursus]
MSRFARFFDYPEREEQSLELENADPELFAGYVERRCRDLFLVRIFSDLSHDRGYTQQIDSALFFMKVWVASWRRYAGWGEEYVPTPALRSQLAESLERHVRTKGRIIYPEVISRYEGAELALQVVSRLGLGLRTLNAYANYTYLPGYEGQLAVFSEFFSLWKMSYCLYHGEGLPWVPTTRLPQLPPGGFD